MTRIVFIGAGSVEFTRNLLGDTLTFPELADAEIVLHDIDADRLATAEAMARWTSEALGAKARIAGYLDRRRALEGADFVINTIEVGGIAATRRDFEIPRTYGLRQTIADTSGVGGIFRALRTIPVMLGIAGDMAELCPDAWMLNYTNPMAMNCWGWYAGSPHQRIVGLCHSIQNTSRQIAEYVGVPPEEITFRGAGVNHMSWVLRVEHEGKSLYPALDEAIAADPDGLGRHVRVQIYRALVTSRPNRVSTSPSTCPGSCVTSRRSNACASRSMSTFVAAKRTSICTPRRSVSLPPAKPSPSSAVRSTPR